ncbi:MAG: hypothetical protein ACJA0S_001255 [Rickettsiales bacterium]|jgi:uncharacterized protein (DUF2237 family)
MIANDNEACNILGTKLQSCCFEPKTGFYRDGFCNTDQNDHGRHIICAIMSDEFLQFSKKMGNDLTRAVPKYGFPGLKAGDKWCLCILRWREALENGIAPKIILESCHKNCLEYVSIEELEKHSI